MNKPIIYRGIQIDKYAQSRYAITQGEDTFRFASFRAAVDFANFICEDKEKQRLMQLNKLQGISEKCDERRKQLAGFSVKEMDWKSFSAKPSNDEGSN